MKGLQFNGFIYRRNTIFYFQAERGEKFFQNWRVYPQTERDETSLVCAYLKSKVVKLENDSIFSTVSYFPKWDSITKWVLISTGNSGVWHKVSMKTQSYIITRKKLCQLDQLLHAWYTKLPVSTPITKKVKFKAKNTHENIIKCTYH